MNCYQAKAGELAKQWYVIDASGQVVGRLAAQIAPILMGKHRPTYTPHIDTGDYVIVTNVDKVVFTGKKWQDKSYQRYSGYPGGQREEAAWKLFQRHPERILELAIQRMMPKSKLGRHMMDKLKLYVGPDHPHQAQGPIPLEAMSGRPTPAGALFTPPPTPRGEGRKRTAKSEPAAVTKAPSPIERVVTEPSDERYEAASGATVAVSTHEQHEAPAAAMATEPSGEQAEAPAHENPPAPEPEA